MGCNSLKRDLSLDENENEKVISEDDVLLKPKPCSMQHKIIDFRMLTKLRLAEMEETYIARRLGSICPKLSWNPSDITCGKVTAVVRFKVSRPVNIESYGFYGPFQKASAGKYIMEISLLTENFCEISQVSSVTPIVRHGEIFHIKFDNAVPILPCIWYMAKFSLFGPPTSQSQSVIPVTNVRCGDFGDVRFYFEMPDSNQMPEIGFILRA